MDLSIYNAKPNKTIREHTDDLLDRLNRLDEFGYIKNQKLYDLLSAACEYHDYGKVNREFQKRMKNGSKFNKNTEIVHNVLSLYFVDKNMFKNPQDYYKVSFAVLNHHDYCNNFKTIEDEENRDLIKNLLSDFDIFPITRRTIANIWNVAEYSDTIMVKGLLHRCDYSASSGDEIEYKNDFLETGLENLLNTWKESKKDSIVKWNRLQEFCKENTDNNIMVVAQTGMGKTEAGLHWIGNNKGFFVLPLKSAINAIYSRIKNDILDNKNIQNRLALLHSDALSYYNKNNNKEMDIMDYYRHSKQFSVPLSISTADQLFDFVFKYQGYELKLATLSYSKIVIDEIQMYSPDILAFLICGIKRINKLGGKIAILTATLAPFVRDLLKNGNNPIEFVEETFTNDKKRHNIKAIDSRINSDTIYSKFIENNSKGISNRILVVCNTVKEAQKIYRELLDKNLTNLNILHGKFIKCERSAKEKEIVEFGQTKDPSEGIWITTQIVEASLDIDFDYLFTELSDINGLFQRLGRCNRGGEKCVDEYNCFVFLDINKGLLTNGNKGFIDRKIYEISRNAISNINGVLSEQEKVNIINKHLTTENLRGSDYLTNYHEFSKWIEGLNPYEIDKRDVKFRNIISYDVIPEVIYKKNANEINKKSILLLDNRVDKVEKIQLREDIKKYTVPVGIYDIDINGRKTIAKNIQLSRNEFVHVVKCHYNELGFMRLSNEEVSTLPNEINRDNFF